jgi:DNA replication licensing factor MCM6
VNAEMMRQAQGGGGGGRDAGGIASQGVTGLKALGVRDLQYKTAFLGCMVQQADSRVGFVVRVSPRPGVGSMLICARARREQGSAGGIRGDENSDEDQDAFLNSLTPEELDELKNMVNTDHIYQRLVQSIAPTVYGELSTS